MKLKLITIMLMLVVSALSANAQWIQSVNCDSLFEQKDLLPQTEFEELAEVCFYGSGFNHDGELEVDNIEDHSTAVVSLQNDEQNYEEEVEVRYGVISSLSFIPKFFSDVVAGIYKLVVNFDDQEYQYSEDVIVHGNQPDNDQNPEDEENSDIAEVPEFSTIAASAALAGIGYYTRKRRFDLK